MSLLRLNDFIPGTTIFSGQVDAELNQLVEALNGVKDVDILHKFNHATNPVLNLNQLGAGLILRGQQNGVDRATLSALGKLLLPAGIGAAPSSDQISNLGTYFSDFENRSTGANTNETDFSVKSMSANVLAADSDFILLIASIQFAANANTKRYRIYVGPNAVYDTGAVAFNGVNHMIVGIIGRAFGNTIKATFINIATALGTGSGLQYSEPSAYNFGNSHTIKSTGLNGSAVALDIIQRSFTLIKGSV